jgi:hypothetical protein
MPILRALKFNYLFAFLLGCASLSAQNPPIREYQIKAVFLFNFSQFVEWPISSFPSPQSALVIGILGEDNFGSYLDEIVNEEQVNGHPLTIQRYHHINDIKTCHILFINRTEAKNMEQTIANLKGRNILTVSDAPDFIKKGGMIRFFTVNNKIQLQINSEASKSADLVISSKLLRLAEIVIPNKK